MSEAEQQVEIKQEVKTEPVSVASTQKEPSPLPASSDNSGTRLEFSPIRRERREVDLGKDSITESMERQANQAAVGRYEYMREREDLVKRKTNKLLIGMFSQRITLMLAEAKNVVDRCNKAVTVVKGIRPYLHLLAPDPIFHKTAERMGRDRASIHIDIGSGKHDIYTFVDEETERHKIAMQFLQECAGRQQSLFDSHVPSMHIQDMHVMRIKYAQTSSLLQNLNDLLSLMRDQYTIVVSTTAALTAIRHSGLLNPETNSPEPSMSTVAATSDDDVEADSE